MADTLNPDTVYVCPERDIECGRRAANWCATCPQRAVFPDMGIPASGRSSSSVSEGEMPELPPDEVLRELWGRAGKEGTTAWSADESATNRHTWQLRKFYELSTRAATKAAAPAQLVQTGRGLARVEARSVGTC